MDGLGAVESERLRASQTSLPEAKCSPRLFDVEDSEGEYV